MSIFNNDLKLLQKAYQSIHEALFNIPKRGEKEVVARKVDPKTGQETIQRQDLSGFIYQETNLGKEMFTIWTIRTNDSKKDPTKKAGDVMIVNGRWGPCRKDVKGVGSPLGSPAERYAKYDLITMCVTSIDGVDYTIKSPAESRTRHVKVDKIFRLAIGNNVYEVV